MIVNLLGFLLLLPSYVLYAGEENKQRDSIADSVSITKYFQCSVSSCKFTGTSNFSVYKAHVRKHQNEIAQKQSAGSSDQSKEEAKRLLLDLQGSIDEVRILTESYEQRMKRGEINTGSSPYEKCIIREVSKGHIATGDQHRERRCVIL